jgi:hypothetical protein
MVDIVFDVHLSAELVANFSIINDLHIRRVVSIRLTKENNQFNVINNLIDRFNRVEK